MNEPSSPGHQQWVHALVERYERPLTVYALRFLHDPEKARDAVQEVFLRLCRQRREDLTSPESAWLYTVCRNVALDQLRKDKRMKPLSQEAIDTTASAASGPGQASENQELQSLMLQRLGNLPEHQQECIRLKFQHGHSYREIAQITQMSVSNVGYLIHTGLQSLRKQLV
jgi:RNA polymerase sigma-70 factor (ECF subfamily)